uniref:Uncharacterized protein n=1 Tax=Romanomermis culicivorax TaxID=13658 RepID=A0A915JFJ1_ROMCU
MHSLQLNQQDLCFRQFELPEEKSTNEETNIRNCQGCGKLTIILTKEHVCESLLIKPRAAEVALSELLNEVYTIIVHLPIMKVQRLSLVMLLINHLHDIVMILR